MSPATDTNKTTLIIIRGVPGSGKSYLAQALLQSIGDDKAIIIDPDMIDKNGTEYQTLSKSLTAEGIDVKFHPYRFLREAAYQAISEHKIIIWNQAFNDFNGLKVTIDRLRTFAAKHGFELPVLVVEVEVSSDVAKERIANRAAGGGHDVPGENLQGFVSQYQSFAGNGYNTVTVNGEATISMSVELIRWTLQNN